MLRAAAAAGRATLALPCPANGAGICFPEEQETSPEGVLEGAGNTLPSCSAQGTSHAGILGSAPTSPPKTALPAAQQSATAVRVSAVSIRKQLGPDLFSYIFMISNGGELFNQLAADAAPAAFYLKSQIGKPGQIFLLLINKSWSTMSKKPMFPQKYH